MFKLVNMNKMNKMMLSCVRATELMELKEVVPLSITKKIQLKMHVAMCSGCRNYMKQTKLINQLLNKTFNSKPATPGTDELETAIVKKL
jgi:predicted anti-sigma-YlaC factor YlaD